MRKTLACVALLLATLLSQTAAARGLKVQAVEVELVADRVAVRPGEAFKLGLRIRHDPHWHTYWRNPGDSGLPTQLTLSLPDGLQAGPIEWMTPQIHRVGPLANFGYDGEVILPVSVQTAASLPGEAAQIAAHAEWLVCKDVCIPGQADLSLRLPIDRRGPAKPSDQAGLFDAMAARTPRTTLDGQAAVQDGELSLRVASADAAGGAPQVQFFPYEPGLIDNAAPQRLFALDADREGRPAWRLAIRLADGVDRARVDEAGFFARPAGVLVVDGQAFEYAGQAVAALPAGQSVAGASTATAAAAASASASASSPSASAARSSSSPSGAGAPGGVESIAGATTLAVAVVFALFGGVLLNLMPCVFPVVGLKVLGFAQQASAGRVQTDAAALRGMRHHALWFTAGVLMSFWLLAGVLMALQAAGEAVGWGFQMQSPAFVATMALLFVAIGLNLSGVFEVGASLTRLGQYDRGGHGALGAWLSGALAVAVATPCSAPFMGSALGFTLGRSALEILLVFTALGLGMALPYLVLGWVPGWLRRLPRPGRWMQSLRQFLAFPMYATAVWLAWVLAQQAGVIALFGWLAGAVALGLAAWLYGRFGQAGGDGATAPRHAWSRPLATGAGLLVALLAVWLAWPSSAEPPSPAAESSALPAPKAVTAPSGGASLERGVPSRAPSAWATWSPAAVEQARSGGQPVFVDFTAAWCVSCQVNKKLVLDSERVIAEMDRLQVVRLRADWTRLDAAIREELARHGRSGVPLYLLFRPGEAVPRILPEVLTPGIVLAALGE